MIFITAIEENVLVINMEVFIFDSALPPKARKSFDQNILFSVKNQC